MYSEIMYYRSSKKAKSTPGNFETIVSPVDTSLLLIICLLSIIGLMAVLSASSSYGFSDQGDYFYYFKKQFVSFIVGFIFMGFFIRFNYKKLRQYIKPVSMVLLVLLVCTMIMGRVAFGASRWFLGMQPSELAKPICIILMAMGLSECKKIVDPLFMSKIGTILALAALILLQPNLSMFIIIMVTMLAMCFVGGISFSLLFSGCVSFLSIAVLSIMHKTYQSARITGWLDPWSDPNGKGYNLIQSWYAISSGGIFGVGFGASKQKLLWLPFGYTDFIFAVIAEEFGFLGCLFLLGILIAFIHSGFMVAKRASDRFGSLLAFGITFMIGFQAFINIGVATGVLPATGVTLPLISYGGTSVVVTMAMIGILLNISRYKIKRINPYVK